MALTTQLFLFFVLVALPRTFSNEWVKPIFLVRDVGQGSWSTYIDRGHCLHLDAGGETRFWQTARGLTQEICQSRKKMLLLTHWDRDHWSYAVKKDFSEIEVFLGPQAGQETKKKILKSLQKNRPRNPSSSEELRHKNFRAKISKTHFLSNAINGQGTSLHPFHRGKMNKVQSQKNHQLIIYSPGRKDLSPVKAKKSRNRSSWVYLLSNLILYPGDSPSRTELLWSRKIKGPVEVFLLGHHGSRNSTGPSLAQKLKGSRIAIASARKKRYGHPHEEVQSRLGQQGIPLISTDQFGHILLELSKEANLSSQNHSGS